MSLVNVSIISNTTSSYSHGGGVRNNGIITMTNSIIAPKSSEDCFGIINSLGHNIAGDNSCNLVDPGGMNNTDSLLGPLQDNGGPTMTQLPRANSPAVDAGNIEFCPATDQRGYQRPVDSDGDGVANCDIGATELQAFELPPSEPPTSVTLTGELGGQVNPNSHLVLILLAMLGLIGIKFIHYSKQNTSDRF